MTNFDDSVGRAEPDDSFAAVDDVSGVADSGIVSLAIDMAAGRAVSAASVSVSVLPAAASLHSHGAASVSSGSVSLPSPALVRNSAASALFRKLRRQVDAGTYSLSTSSGAG